MSLGRPLARLQLEPEQREQLEAMASSRSLPHGLVTRVRIVLLSADGLSNKGHRNPVAIEPSDGRSLETTVRETGADRIARGACAPAACVRFPMKRWPR